MHEWRSEIRSRLAALKLRPEREAEIVEEVTQHLDDRYREMRASGRDHDAAVAETWRELEARGVLAREVAQSEHSQPLELPPPGAPARGRWLSSLWQDARYAVRSLRKQPAFAATVILALALSIGPVTAIVSLGNWLFWRPLPGVSGADRLGLIWFGNWRSDSSVGPSWVSYLNIADLNAGMKTATGFTGFQEISVSLIVGDRVPRVIDIGQVTGDFFDVLGVRPVAGRMFSADEDRPPRGAPVVVISTGLATTEFGSPAGALGQRLLLNRQSFSVIGVAPAAFAGVTNTSRVDAWMTGATSGYLSGRKDDGRAASRTDNAFYMFIARLADGASFTQLEAELGGLTRGLAEAYPKENAKFTTATARVFPRLGLQATTRPGMRSMLNLLLAIGGVLVVLGCANVANMLIARAIRREPEVAIRQALGASGRRLVQLQLTESGLLALSGAVLGLGLAFILTRIIQQLLFPRPPGFEITMPMDVRVLGVTLAASLVTGLVAGLAPAWLMARSRRALVGAVGRAGAGRTASRAPRLRSSLAIVQLALSVTLLVGALLLVATLRNLHAVDLGFDPKDLMTMRVSLAAQGYTADRAVAFQQELQHALQPLSVIQSVAIAQGGPFGVSSGVHLLPPGVTSREQAIRAWINGVSDTYFSTVSTPILRGRAFTADEIAVRGPIDNMPVIVNESLARRLVGDVNAVGATVRLAATISYPVTDLPIVGVVRDSFVNKVTGDAELFLYQPLGRSDLAALTAGVIVRSTEPAPVVTAAVRAAAARIDPAVPLLPARPVIDEITRSFQQQRLFATMLGWVSVLAFVLAAIGLHGLVSQVTIERAREFGIRLAMGARRADILRLVARWVCLIAGLGTIVGLVLAGFGTRLVASLLFGVTAIDPIIYTAAVVLMACIVALAAAWPAFRATRIEPVNVLRTE
jgi:putative ABC transport system permease protein